MSDFDKFAKCCKKPTDEELEEYRKEKEFYIELTLDKKHRDALREVLEAARDFDFSGRDDDGAAEEVVEDLLEAIQD